MTQSSYEKKINKICMALDNNNISAARADLAVFTSADITEDNPVPLHIAGIIAGRDFPLSDDLLPAVVVNNVRETLQQLPPDIERMVDGFLSGLEYRIKIKN